MAGVSTVAGSEASGAVGVDSARVARCTTPATAQPTKTTTMANIK